MAFAQLEPDEIAHHRPQVVALDIRIRIVEKLDYVPVGANGG